MENIDYADLDKTNEYIASLPLDQKWQLLQEIKERAKEIIQNKK